MVGEGKVFEMSHCPVCSYTHFLWYFRKIGGKQVLVPVGWKIGRFPYLADGCKGMFSVPKVAKVFIGLVLYYWLLSTVIGC